MNFADTYWLEAMFFDLADEQKSHRGTVNRFLRHNPDQLGVSHLVGG